MWETQRAQERKTGREVKRKEESVDGCFNRRVEEMEWNGRHVKGLREERGAGRVIMGGCCHSFPLVEEPGICGRGGEGRCHSKRKWTWWAVWCRKPRNSLKNCRCECACAWMHGDVCAGSAVYMYYVLNCAVVYWSQTSNGGEKKDHNTGIAALVCCGNVEWCHLNDLIWGFPGIVVVK